MTPVYLRVKVGGRDWTHLRKEIAAHIKHSYGFEKMKGSRLLLNHYEVKSLDEETAASLVNSIYEIAKTFANAEVKQVMVFSFSTILINLGKG